jgi:hypothetical protein
MRVLLIFVFYLPLVMLFVVRIGLLGSKLVTTGESVGEPEPLFAGIPTGQIAVSSEQFCILALKIKLHIWQYAKRFYAFGNMFCLIGKAIGRSWIILCDT